MSDDNSSIAAQLETISELAAPHGYELRRYPHPPYGWELVKSNGAVAVWGSLDQVERFLRNPAKRDRSMILTEAAL
ncbi:hypothetical protein ACW2Q0_18785 [Nocardia sp. R16R-3T]